MILALTHNVDDAGQLDGVALVDGDVEGLGDELGVGGYDLLVAVGVVVVGGVLRVLVRVVVVHRAGVTVCGQTWSGTA